MSLCLKDPIPKEHCVPLRLLTPAHDPEGGSAWDNGPVLPEAGICPPLPRVPSGTPAHLGSLDVPDPTQTFAASKHSAVSRGMLTGKRSSSRARLLRIKHLEPVFYGEEKTGQGSVEVEPGRSKAKAAWISPGTLGIN